MNSKLMIKQLKKEVLQKGGICIFNKLWPNLFCLLWFVNMLVEIANLNFLPCKFIWFISRLFIRSIKWLCSLPTTIENLYKGNGPIRTHAVLWSSLWTLNTIEFPNFTINRILRTHFIGIFCAIVKPFI